MANDTLYGLGEMRRDNRNEIIGGTIETLLTARQVLAKFGPDTPLAALCRAYLAGDESAAPVLLDAASEYYHHTPGGLR